MIRLLVLWFAIALCLVAVPVEAVSPLSDRIVALEQGTDVVLMPSGTRDADISAAIAAGQIEPPLTRVHREAGGKRLAVVSAVGLRHPVGHKARAGLDLAQDYIAALSDLLVPFSMESLRPSSRQASPNGDVRQVFVQTFEGLPVYMGYVAAVIDRADALILAEANVADERELDRAVQQGLPLLDDLVEDAAGFQNIEVVLFDSALVPAAAASTNGPVLAWLAQGPYEGKLQEIVLDASGAVLHSVPLVMDFSVEQYRGVVYRSVEVEGIRYLWPIPPPRQNVLLQSDSDQTCGIGTWPDCSYYEWDDVFLRLFTMQFDEYLWTRFGWDSWDDEGVAWRFGAGMDDPDYSYDEWFGQWGIITGLKNALFNAVVGGAFFSHETVSADATGHEFAHGTDYRQSQPYLHMWTVDQMDGLAEGYSDIIGEAFQQAYYPSVTKWLIPNGLSQNIVYRNLADPALSQRPVWEQDFSYTIVPDPHPAHATEFDLAKVLGFGDEPDPHFHATILGKALHLLGRPGTEGSVSFYGVNVTGIGIEDAAKIFWGAFTTYRTTTPLGFGSVRTSVSSSAGAQFGYSSNQYVQAMAAMNAVGFWSSNSLLSFPGGVRSPDGSSLVVSDPLNPGHTYRKAYYFYNDSGTCKMLNRFRCLQGGFPSFCWSPAVAIDDCASAPRAVRIGNAIYVTYQDSLNNAMFLKIDSSGSYGPHDLKYNGGGPFVVAPNTELTPVDYGSTSYVRLLYSPSGGGTMRMGYLYLPDRNVTSYVSTTIPGSVEYDADQLGSFTHVVYVSANGQLGYRKYNGYWSAGVVPPALIGRTVGMVRIAESNGALHLSVNNPTDLDTYPPISSCKTEGVCTSFVQYGSCRDNCDEPGDWSRFNTISPTNAFSTANRQLTEMRTLTQALIADWFKEGSLTALTTFIDGEDNFRGVERTKYSQ